MIIDSIPWESESISSSTQSKEASFTFILGHWHKRGWIQKLSISRLFFSLITRDTYYSVGRPNVIPVNYMKVCHRNIKKSVNTARCSNFTTVTRCHCCVNTVKTPSTKRLATSKPGISHLPSVFVMDTNFKKCFCFIPPQRMNCVPLPLLKRSDAIEQRLMLIC